MVPLIFMNAVLILAASSEVFAQGLATVPFVDLDRYIGRWYEIARYPNRFQEGCVNAEAHYSPGDGGKIKVRNICWEEESGKERQVEGIADIVDSATNAKLKVSFLPAWLRWTGIGWGDYWIIMLGSDYGYSVVSEPERKFLWILSREPNLPTEIYMSILNQLSERGFDTHQLVKSQIVIEN